MRASGIGFGTDRPPTSNGTGPRPTQKPWGYTQEIRISGLFGSRDGTLGTTNWRLVRCSIYRRRPQMKPDSRAERRRILILAARPQGVCPHELMPDDRRPRPSFLSGLAPNQAHPDRPTGAGRGQTGSSSILSTVWWRGCGWTTSAAPAMTDLFMRASAKVRPRQLRPRCGSMSSSRMNPEGRCKRS